jgi:hypothetical protein
MLKVLGTDKEVFSAGEVSRAAGSPFALNNTKVMARGNVEESPETRYLSSGCERI